MNRPSDAATIQLETPLSSPIPLNGNLSSNLQGPSRILMTADCIGGVWNYSLDLVEALARFGVEVGLATMGPRPSHSQKAQAARLPNLKLFESDYKLEWMDLPWVDVDAAGNWLLNLAHKFRPDIVHLNGFSHAALRWEVPVVVVAHSCIRSWWKAVKSEPVPLALTEYTRRVSEGLRRADMVVAPSNAMMRAIEEHYGVPVPKKVIPNGRFASRYFANRKEAFILTAGRLWDEAKGLNLLERIAPRLKWPVLAAGEIRSASDSPRQRGQLQILGQLNNSKLAEYLSSAGIYASPALYEPFGLAVLEAALSGCALVLSDIRSFQENWRGAAMLIPAGDQDAWCAALNHLAKDPVLRGNLARQSQARAAQLEPEKIGGRYFTTYSEVLSQGAIQSPRRFAQ
jgi:glycogen synthase